MSNLRAELRHAKCGGLLEIVIRTVSVERVHAVYKNDPEGEIVGKGSVTEVEEDIHAICKKCKWHFLLMDASSYADAVDFLRLRGYILDPEWEEV